LAAQKGSTAKDLLQHQGATEEALRDALESGARLASRDGPEPEQKYRALERFTRRT
jgi:hypothetical protein